MSVLTVYPSIGYSFHRNHEQGGTWAQWWADTTCSGYGQDYYVAGSVYYGGNSNSYGLFRYTLSFNTSSIPTGATISSAIFSAYRKEEIDGDGHIPCYLYLCPVSETGNSAGYYNKSYFGTAVATLTGSPNNSNVNQWWQPNIDASAIIKAGTTILGLRHWCDYNNSAPGGASGITGRLTFADYNDATYKPYLSITWTTPAVVTTGVASDVGATTATLAGNVTDAGGGTISERGVCWGLTTNPTTSSPKASTSGTTGSFTVPATNLGAGMEYHYRAYVITENSTQYGADSTFRTQGGAILFNLL